MNIKIGKICIGTIIFLLTSTISSAIVINEYSLQDSSTKSINLNEQIFLGYASIVGEGDSNTLTAVAEKNLKITADNTNSNFTTQICQRYSLQYQLFCIKNQIFFSPVIFEFLCRYAENKWKGHVFCPSQPQLRKKINRAALKIFKEQLDIEFNDYATIFAKISSA